MKFMTKMIPWEYGNIKKKKGSKGRRPTYRSRYVHRCQPEERIAVLYGKPGLKIGCDKCGGKWQHAPLYPTPQPNQ